MVVSNAGIVRDQIVHKVSRSDGSAVVAVHLNGHLLEGALVPLDRSGDVFGWGPV